MRSLGTMLVMALVLPGCAASVSSGLSADEAKASLLDKAFFQYDKIAQKISEGSTPKDAGRLYREVGALKIHLSGDLSSVGEKLEKQVSDLETMLEAKKPDAAKVKAAVEAIGATLQEIKAKL